MKPIIVSEKVISNRLRFMRILCLVSLLVTAMYWYVRIDVVRNGIRGEGVVVDTDRCVNETCSGRRRSYPIVSYATGNVVHTFKSTTMLEIPVYMKGDVVPLLVSSDGNRAHINTFLRLWSAPILWTLIFGFTFTTYILMYKRRVNF
jgi:hypothetical protein